jgi:hypothetical protein
MSKPIKFENINVGDTLPAYKRKFTQEMVDTIMDLIGSVPNWYTDPKQARKVSEWEIEEEYLALPGIMTEIGVTDFMINWLGDPKPWYCGGGMEIKLIAPVQVHVKEGGEVIYKGKVIEKKEEEGKKIVVCEIYAEHRGVKVMKGTARVAF